MKKGCFFRTIIIITVLVAAALYIFENKFDEYFVKPGKKYLVEILETDLKDDFNMIKESAEKDSLKNLIASFIENVKSSDKFTFSVNDSESFTNYLSKAAEDSIISKEELIKISSILGKIENERLPEN